MASFIELVPMTPSDTSRFLVEDTPRGRSPVGVADLFNQQNQADEEESLSEIHPPWKRSLFALLERPKTSPSAFVVHMLTTSLILLSALITVLETVPAFHSISTRSWFGIETSLVALFTIEYVSRCVAWSYSWVSLLRWMTCTWIPDSDAEPIDYPHTRVCPAFFGIIDLLSVLPYYIELILQQDTSVLFRFSILRMFRLLRVFKPFRYNHTILLTIEVMYVSVRRSQHALLAIGFFVIMLLTVFSTLLYFTERGTWDPVLETFVNADGDPTQFSSIPAAAWFVLVTITTVGYGEITPRSFLGRLVTLPILVFGLLLITLPSFVLGREFSIVWERMTRGAKDVQPEENGSTTHTPFLYPGAPTSASADLSNRKLAMNQTELSRQISELRLTVEMQGKTLQQLLDALANNSTELRNRKGKDVERLQ